MILHVTRAERLTGTVRPPSDKSLTHRAYIFAALASQGSSVIMNPLQGEDCQGTLRIMQQLGATVDMLSAGSLVSVTPPTALQQPLGVLDCGNSGTTIRLLAGVLAAQKGLDVTLVGDESLSRRPMKRVVEPLRLMGADIEGDTAPVTIHGKKLRGIDYATPVASAQIKSCVLLAGLFADGTTRVTEPSQSRDHTERMLNALGVELVSEGATTIAVDGGQNWSGFEFSVPSDISSAAFLLCAAAMVPDARVTLTDVGTNPTRTGVLEALAQAGARLAVLPCDDQMGEPVSHIEAAHVDDLRAFEVSGELVPRLIDEIPVLAVLATQCQGITRFRDAKELRVKETDRIEVVASNLRKMGAQVETYEDGLDVTGPVALHGAEVDATGDHRIGMAFAVAGLVADGETVVHNADSIRTSYPGFEADIAALTGRTITG